MEEALFFPLIDKKHLSDDDDDYIETIKILFNTEQKKESFHFIHYLHIEPRPHLPSLSIEAGCNKKAFTVGDWLQSGILCVCSMKD